MEKYSLVGSCDICGNITAVDLDGTPEHEREMQRPDRTVRRVTEAEARRLWTTGKACDHKALIANLRAALPASS